jgi:hypothetical protein
MPEFLDFTFSFGRQQYAQDFHFSGFRQETYLNAAERTLRISELGRSGRGFHMCYSLKSVERYASAPHWPWSIRQMAVYHSFDIETGKTFWIVLKANRVMKDRIESATKDGTHSDLSSFDDTAHAFASSLATQLLLCRWCVENWRWYINFLEETLREATGRAAIRIYKVPDPVPSADFQATLSRRTFSGRTLTDKTPMEAPMFPPPSPFAPLQPSQLPQELPPLPSSLPKVGSDGEDFSFSDLQRVQHIEDKANELLLVLEANTHVLTELIKYYKSLASAGDLPPELLPSWKTEFDKFERGISSLTNDLHTQQSRAKTLVKLLEDRKNLVCPYNMATFFAQFARLTHLALRHPGIPKHPNRQTTLNPRAALRPPHGSHDVGYASDRAEDEAGDCIDADHHSRDPLLLARHIHIRTSLHFLPLSLSLHLPNPHPMPQTPRPILSSLNPASPSLPICSIQHWLPIIPFSLSPALTSSKTIMSTDIIHFNRDLTSGESIRNFQIDALRLWIAATLPITVLSFIAWYVVYLYINKVQEAKAEKLRAQAEEMGEAAEK